MNKKLLVPELFHATQLLEDNPPTKEALKADKLNYIISLIYDPLDTNLGYDGYTILNAVYLKNVISNYKDYLNYLAKYNIIECDEIFIPGVRSKGYRLKDISMSTSQEVEVEVTDKSLLKKFFQQKEKIKEKNKIAKGKYPFLMKWFNKNLQVELPEGITDKRVINSAHRINAQQYNFTVDNYGVRLHTDITRFKKDYRKYIKYEGDRMKNIDVKNCQPYLLVKLLLEDLKKSNETIYNTMLKAGGEDLASQDDLMILYLKHCEGYKNLACYIEDVTKGRMYTKVLEAFEAKYQFKIDRNQIKEYLMPVYFGKKNYKSKTKTVFKELYPYVDAFLGRYKDSRKICLIKQLQKLESGLVIRKIAPKLPVDMPRFTIHDSFFVRAQDVEVVKNKVLSVMKSAIGFYPKVSIE
jgi:hypothetical protein